MKFGACETLVVISAEQRRIGGVACDPVPFDWRVPIGKAHQTSLLKASNDEDRENVYS